MSTHELGGYTGANNSIPYEATVTPANTTDFPDATGKVGLDVGTVLSDVHVLVHGTTDGGIHKQVPVTSEGHLEVAIHEPRSAFGSLLTESPEPVFQIDGVYGLNGGQTLSTVSGTGSVSSAQSAFVCSTGTTALSQAILQTRKRARYRPGQGIICRFTAMYTSPVASSYQIAGLGHAEDGMYFAYVGTSFGILHVERGVREIQTLTVSTGSSTAENVTVTLNGVATAVAVTNSASTLRTAYEISLGTYSGWKAEAVGSTVVFLADSVGDKAGAFTLAGTTVVGAFAQTLQGAASTDTFVAQTAWNGDVCDGSGSASNPSGFLLDPLKLNVFQIKMQYLGAGAITCQVEHTGDGTNNPAWVSAHTFKFPGTRTRTTFGNPSFPLTLAAYSAGSVTNLSVTSGSAAAFVEGARQFHGNRMSYQAQSAVVDASAYRALVTFRNSRVYGGRANHAVINLMSVAAAAKHNNPVIVYVLRNATLAGNPSFAQYATTSCTMVDTAATTCTIATNDQIVWSGMLGETGQIVFSFEDLITLQPGESFTVAAKTVFGTASYVVASVNTREDQ